MLLVSWCIQAGMIVVLIRFCATVYADLIILKGSRIKLRTMLRMAAKANRTEVTGQ